jgi:hypothetical protein
MAKWRKATRILADETAGPNSFPIGAFAGERHKRPFCGKCMGKNHQFPLILRLAPVHIGFPTCQVQFFLSGTETSLRL